MLVGIGIIIIVAGLIIIFFGNKEIPVRGGIVLKLLDKRSRSDEDSLPGWSYRVLFGGALIVGGVLVLLKALKLT
jgi:hypothetical protein